MATPTRTQRLQARCDALLGRAQLMIDSATRDVRALTDAENTEHKALLEEHAKLLPQISASESDDAAAAMLHGLGTGGPRDPLRASIVHAPGGVRSAESLGAQFVNQLGGWIRETRGSRGSAWRSPSAELTWPGFSAATISGDPASGGDLVVPHYLAGITPSSTAPLAVADLFASGPTDSNLITYMVEKTFVNAADTVLEGIAKPESTITFDAVSDPVRKIAHWLPVTDEMFEDVPALRAYIDARLRLGVQLTLDDQLLNGTTTAPDIIGIRNRVGLGPDVPRGTDTVEDAILKAMEQVEATGFAVSGVAINRVDWNAIQLSKTSTGEYLGTGPFAAPQSPTLWGVPVAITNAMPAGTALVGAFRTAAMVFYKGGLRVEASSSHADFWIRNMTAVRSELRAALAVMMPQAFAQATELGATVP